MGRMLEKQNQQLLPQLFNPQEKCSKCRYTKLKFRAIYNFYQGKKANNTGTEKNNDKYLQISNKIQCVWKQNFALKNISTDFFFALTRHLCEGFKALSNHCQYPSAETLVRN